MAGTRPIPYFSGYSASKAFNDYFSRALNGEYSGKVDVLSLRPFYVSTPATFERKLGPETISPEQCAEGCLRALGRSSWTWGHYKHSIQGFVVGLNSSVGLLNVEIDADRGSAYR